MKITKDSHLDHALQPEHIAFIERTFGDRQAFFLETVELPPELPSLPCSLVGPAVGKPAVSEAEVTYMVRGERKGPSRIVSGEPSMVRTLTVIGGEHEGEVILFTAYGGPCAPREPWDESLDDAGREEARAFWSEHALV